MKILVNTDNESDRVNNAEGWADADKNWKACKG